MSDNVLSFNGLTSPFSPTVKNIQTCPNDYPLMAGGYFGAYLNHAEMIHHKGIGIESHHDMMQKSIHDQCYIMGQTLKMMLNLHHKYNELTSEKSIIQEKKNNSIHDFNFWNQKSWIQSEIIKTIFKLGADSRSNYPNFLSFETHNFEKSIVYRISQIINNNWGNLLGHHSSLSSPCLTTQNIRKNKHYLGFNKPVLVRQDYFTINHHHLIQDALIISSENSPNGKDLYPFSGKPQISFLIASVQLPQSITPLSNTLHSLWEIPVKECLKFIIPYVHDTFFEYLKSYNSDNIQKIFTNKQNIETNFIQHMNEINLTWAVVHALSYNFLYIQHNTLFKQSPMINLHAIFNNSIREMITHGTISEIVHTNIMRHSVVVSYNYTEQNNPLFHKSNHHKLLIHTKLLIKFLYELQESPPTVFPEIITYKTLHNYLLDNINVLNNFQENYNTYATLNGNKEETKEWLWLPIKDIFQSLFFTGTQKSSLEDNSLINSMYQFMHSIELLTLEEFFSLNKTSIIRQLLMMCAIPSLISDDLFYAIKKSQSLSLHNLIPQELRSSSLNKDNNRFIIYTQRNINDLYKKLINNSEYVCYVPNESFYNVPLYNKDSYNNSQTIVQEKLTQDDYKQLIKHNWINNSYGKIFPHANYTHQKDHTEEQYADAELLQELISYDNDDKNASTRGDIIYDEKYMNNHKIVFPFNLQLLTLDMMSNPSTIGDNRLIVYTILPIMNKYGYSQTYEVLDTINAILENNEQTFNDIDNMDQNSSMYKNFEPYIYDTSQIMYAIFNILNNEKDLPISWVIEENSDKIRNSLLEEDMYEIIPFEQGTYLEAIKTLPPLTASIYHENPLGSDSYTLRQKIGPPHHIQQNIHINTEKNINKDYILIKSLPIRMNSLLTVSTSLMKNKKDQFLLAPYYTETEKTYYTHNTYTSLSDNSSTLFLQFTPYNNSCIDDVHELLEAEKPLIEIQYTEDTSYRKEGYNIPITYTEGLDDPSNYEKNIEINMCMSNTRCKYPEGKIFSEKFVLRYHYKSGFAHDSFILITWHQHGQKVTNPTCITLSPHESRHMLL